MSELSAEQVEQMRNVFKMFDIDGSGSISAAELKQAFTQLGQTPSDQEIQDMITASDSNNNGEIEFEEFLKMMSDKVLNK